MTTENGLVRMKHARRDIEVLRDRKEYLEAKIARKWPEGPPPEPGGPIAIQIISEAPRERVVYVPVPDPRLPPMRY